MTDNKTVHGDMTFRQRYFSSPLLRIVKRVLPSMSDTEREALEAGTIGWDAELFSGKPDWDVLFGQGPAVLSDVEQAFLDGPTNRLCAMLDDWEINYITRKLPDQVWDFIKSNGFLGMIIPTEYGGLGFSASAHSAVVMKVSSRSIAAAVTIMVPNSLGPGELLMEYGTDKQKKHYLPRLADGRDLPCFALTSQEAGSDAASMIDRGIVCYQTYKGKKTLGMKVTWSKRYITLGPVATVLGLAFKLFDPDHILGEQEDLGITVALVPANTPGVEIGRRHFPSGQSFQNGPNSGKDVFMPMDWIIGGEERIGQGWKMLVSALAAGRAISLPSLSTAGAKLAAHATGAYARVREQFNLPIGNFEGVQEALARIGAGTYQLEAARTTTSRMIDRHEKPAVLSAILKYHATERMRKIINDAMDVHGGKGICDGPRNYLGNVYRAIPVGITVEGANILTRSLIIYGQGAVRCHPYLLKEMTAAQDEDQARGLRDFDDAIFRHIGFQLKTFARTAVHNLTFGLFASSPVTGPTKKYFKQMGRQCATFAFVSEVALISLGGALKRKEMLSARLGDVLSELYLMSCVLKKFEEDGRPDPDLPLVTWCCETSLNTIQKSLDEVLANFPIRPLAWFMRLVIFPFGRHQRPPADKTTQAVARLLTEPSDARKRLVAGIFMGGENDPMGQLDIAFEKVASLRHAGRKMRKARVRSIDDALAQKIITKSEAGRMKDARTVVYEILKVDDFSPEELMNGFKTTSGNPKQAKPKTTRTRTKKDNTVTAKPSQAKPRAKTTSKARA